MITGAARKKRGDQDSYHQTIKDAKSNKVHRFSSLFSAKLKSTASHVRDKVHISHASKKPSRSIMIVRTLDDSLHSQKNVELKRERRRILRKLSSSTLDESLGKSKIHELDDGLSVSTSPVLGRDLSVSFKHVEIRKYPFCVGDNPAVAAGAPLTFEWDHVDEETYLVDKYEDLRSGVRQKINDVKRIPSATRKSLLLDQGHSLKDIYSGVKLANVIRRKRRRTVEMLHQAKVEERIENMRRKVLKTIRRTKTRREEMMIDTAMQLARKEREDAAIEDKVEVAKDTERILSMLTATYLCTATLVKRNVSLNPVIAVEEDVPETDDDEENEEESLVHKCYFFLYYFVDFVSQFYKKKV